MALIDRLMHHGEAIVIPSRAVDLIDHGAERVIGPTLGDVVQNDWNDDA